MIRRLRLRHDAEPNADPAQVRIAPRKRRRKDFGREPQDLAYRLVCIDHGGGVRGEITKCSEVVARRSLSPWSR